MNTVFAVLSGVALLLALLCLWIRKRFRAEVALMSATETSRAADVGKLAPGMTVEVKGTIRCDNPLTGELSGSPCVYFKTEVERKDETFRDGESETNTVTERTNVRHVPFEVEDESGRVRVDAEGASVEAEETYNESGYFIPETLALSEKPLTGPRNAERRFREVALATNTPVYVLGTVQGDGTVGAAPAGAKASKFIITYKSEEERARSSSTISAFVLVLAIVLFVASAAFLYAAYTVPA